MSLLATFKTWPVAHVFLGYVFITSGLIINFLMLCTLPLWFINRTVYRRVICLLTYSHWSQLTWLTEWWSGSDCVLYMEPEERKIVGQDHSLVLLNHSYEIDWLMGWTLTERLGMLGATKVYVKNELRYAPLIGWAWYFAEVLFLRRNWARDQHVISSQLNQLADYPQTLAILLYPEGTRFTPEKLIASNKVAMEKGYPTTKHTLLPRTRGFVLSMKSVRSYVPCICDCTIVFPTDAPRRPTLMNVLSGVPLKSAMFIKRIPLSEVPEEDEACARWLIDLFKKKDDIIDHYKRTGELPGEPLPLPIRPYDVVNFTVWCIVLGTPILYLIWLLITSAPLYIIVLWAASLFAISVGLNRLIGITEIKNTSTYGTTDKSK